MHFKTLQDILISCAIEKAHPANCPQMSLSGPISVQQGWPTAAGVTPVV